MTVRDDLADVELELQELYADQREAEYADLDGRVVDRAGWRRQITERAARITVLEQRRKRLLREGDEAA